MRDSPQPPPPKGEQPAKPKRTDRRYLHLGLCWGGIVCFCGCVVLLTLQHLGLIDLETWGRTAIAFVHGRDSYRSQVEIGMTRQDVEGRLGSRVKNGRQFIKVCVLRAPGSTGPLPPELDYPTPFSRVDYPEYGFNVIYHGKDFDHLDDWQVIAIEDRK